MPRRAAPLPVGRDRTKRAEKPRPLRPGPAWPQHAAVQAGRVALAFVPAGAFWGLDAARFLPPVAAVALALLALLAAIPAACGAVFALARRVARAPGALPVALAAALPALAAWSLPDRTLFSGDMLQRLGVVTVSDLVSRFPQTMPLDALLHQSVVRWLAPALGGSPLDANRVIGAVLVFATGLAAAALARTDRVGGRALVALTTGFSGLLLAGTGIGRAEAEVALLGVVIVGSAWRDFESPSRWPVPEAAFVTGLFVHRSILLFAPLVLVLAWRLFARPSESSRGRRIGAAVLALLALTGVPRYWQVLTEFDAVHHLAPRGWTPELLGAGLNPGHLLEAGNALLLVAPAAPILAVVLWCERRATSAAFRLAASLSLLPWLLALLFAHPQQGLFRDFEVFAPLGTLAGFLLGLHLVREGSSEREPRFATGVVLALVAAMLAPMALWNKPRVAHDRLVAFASDARFTGPAHRADVWSFVAMMDEQGGHLGESFEDVSRAYALQPTRRAREQLLFLAGRAGRYDAARRIGLQAIRKGEAGALEWLAVAGAAQALADTALAAAVGDSLRALLRNPHERAVARDALQFRPELWPGERPAWLRQALAPGGP